MNSKKWINRQMKDIYVKQREQQHYIARSAFKLEEIDQKYRLFDSGMRIVDVGCSPGSWTQYLLKKDCQVVGFDILDCEIDDELFTFHKMSILDVKDLGKHHFILSDMAPNLTGNKMKDISSNIELNLSVLALSDFMTKGVVVKAFMSPLQVEFEEEAKKKFTFLYKFKPKSSRTTSSEFYYVALRKGIRK